MRIESAIKSIENLDANIVILSRLHRILNDPNSDLHTISELIITDGPLSAAVLRMSNGAFYGPSEPIDSIFGAINKIGFKEVFRLVSAFISKKVFMQDLKHYSMTAREYWTYSYFCASLLEWLVRERADRVIAYLFGLFHGIGKIGIEKAIRKEGLEIVHDGAELVEDWEYNSLGFSGAEVGAVTLRLWDFDNLLCQLIRTQNKLEDSPMPHLTLSLKAARLIAIHNKYDISLAKWEIPEMDDILQAIRLSQESMADFVDATFHSVKSMHLQLGHA